MDSTFFFFMGLHFMAFVLFHSKRGTAVLLRYRKSANRKVVQETFKGYGKGYKLFRLISKGIEMNVNPIYFVFLLLIRGSSSAFYKTTVLSYLLKKPLSFKKAKMNVLFNSLPAILVYIFYISIVNMTHMSGSGEIILQN